MVNFGEFLKTWSLSSKSVARYVIFKGQKLVENAKIQKFKCDILGDFQTLCGRVRMNTKMKETLHSSKAENYFV